MFDPNVTEITCDDPECNKQFGVRHRMTYTGDEPWPWRRVFVFQCNRCGRRRKIRRDLIAGGYHFLRDSYFARLSYYSFVWLVGSPLVGWIIGHLRPWSDPKLPVLFRIIMAGVLIILPLAMTFLIDYSTGKKDP